MTNALSDRQCRHDEILQTGVAVASGLVMANMNSIPFDWSARQSLGGARFNHYTGKQLPDYLPISIGNIWSKNHCHLET